LEGVVAEEQRTVISYANRSAIGHERNKVKADYLHLMAKEEHYLSRTAFMKSMAESQDFLKKNPKAKTSYLLAMNNYQMVHLNIGLKRELDALLKEEYERLSKEHDFDLPEQPFCIVVPSINNGQGFRYEYNLQSILNQNYSNFKVVVIDDVSNDGNFELLKIFVEDHPVPQSVVLVKNQKRMGTLANIHQGVTQYCEPEDIVALVDGDDELIGVNILKVFNSVYKQHGLDVAYSNYIISNRRDGFVRKGFSGPYSDEDKKQNKYRDHSTNMFPLRTFKVSTFMKVPVADLQDDNGEFFMSASDQVLCPQLLELSCGRNMYIDDFYYFNNKGLGSNDMEVDPNLNYAILTLNREKRKKHQCLDK
jgi:hypothetical protein